MRRGRAAWVLTRAGGSTEVEGCDAGALAPAMAAFAAAGTFFGAAAGNTGPRCDSIDDPPAPYADVLTVAAVGADGVKSSYSSYGTDVVDVAAPGGDLRQRAGGESSGCVLSTLPGGRFGRMCGTSMAAPHVSAVAALVASERPHAGPVRGDRGDRQLRVEQRLEVRPLAADQDPELHENREASPPSRDAPTSRPPASCR